MKKKVILFFSIIDKIYSQLSAGKLKESVILMNAAKETFPDLSADKHQQMETDDDEEKEDPGPLDTLSCLKSLFMGKLGLKLAQKIQRKVSSPSKKTREKVLAECKQGGVQSYRKTVSPKVSL